MSGKNQHWGSTLDDFLHEEGIYKAAKAEAVTRVITWQIAEEMRKQRHYKNANGRADAHKSRSG